jgi:uncharacterized protein (DUF3820 family)
MFNPKEHLMDLKGKAYLQVMWRLVWFRDEHPLWNIDTKMEHYDPQGNHAIFSAKIYDENGMQKSAGYGSESIKDFKDFIEKAETKAIGRALAMLGYGTQFAPELDEGERIVDSPVEVKVKMETVEDAAGYKLTFGKYNGKTLAELFKTDRRYLEWLYDNEQTEEIVKKGIWILLQAAIRKQAGGHV